MPNTTIYIPEHLYRKWKELERKGIRINLSRIVRRELERIISEIESGKQIIF